MHINLVKVLFIYNITKNINNNCFFLEGSQRLQSMSRDSYYDDNNLLYCGDPM
jgi:hypothetical protein